jgi:hypothetical protein
MHTRTFHRISSEEVVDHKELDSRYNSARDAHDSGGPMKPKELDSMDPHKQNGPMNSKVPDTKADLARREDSNYE